MEFRNDCDVYRDRSVRASWKVPAFCCNDWGALKLLEICSAFGFERPFDLVYGAPHCSWSGGRPSAVRSPLDGGLIDAYFSAYAQFGVRCALTFSKLAVDEKDYDNEYNNMLLDYVEKYDGQVILFDDGLARYIKRSRPRIAIVASLNKAMCNLQDSVNRSRITTEIFFAFTMKLWLEASMCFAMAGWTICAIDAIR